jgi:hypothetical protein
MVNPQAPDHYAVGRARRSRRRADPISEGVGWCSNSPWLPISPFTRVSSVDRRRVRLRIDRSKCGQPIWGIHGDRTYRYKEDTRPSPDDWLKPSWG